jgi:hypothetical protein
MAKGPRGEKRPADVIGNAVKVMRIASPAHISTSYVKRQNLTRRFTRLTNGFSNKVANHAHMVALYTTWYNWICVHETLRVSRAMAAGLTDRLWYMEDVLAQPDARDAPLKKRGSYMAR